MRTSWQRWKRSTAASPWGRRAPTWRPRRNTVPGFGPDAGARLASHTHINHLTFTGSVETGIAVMQAAAENVVPVTLELGGKSPNIIFADANLKAAVQGAMQ